MARFARQWSSGPSLRHEPLGDGRGYSDGHVAAAPFRRSSSTPDRRETIAALRWRHLRSDRYRGIVGAHT